MGYVGLGIVNFIIISALFLGSACVNGNLSSGFGVTSVDVQKVYPVNGSNWMDYVDASNLYLDEFSQLDSPCTGTEGSYKQCIHGGEKLMVQLPGFSSCNNLLATDALNNFTWTCRNNPNGVAFYSVALSPKAGLRSLISTSGQWIPNSVTVSNNNGATVAQSSPAVWWSNPIQSAPLNNGASAVVSLTGPGTIYYVVGPQSSNGYSITSDKVGLVVLGPSSLQYGTNAASNCNIATGATVAPTLTALLCVGNGKFDWVEGNFTGATFTSTFVVGAITTNFGNFKNMNVVGTGGPSYALYADSITNSRFRDVVATAAVSPFYILSATFNLFKNIGVSNSVGGDGFTFISSATDNVVSGIDAANNAGNGINLNSACNRNVFFGVNTFNNGGSGIIVNSSIDDIFVGILATGNSIDGINIAAASSNADILAATLINNGTDGILESAGNLTAVNVAMMNNLSSGFATAAGSVSNYMRNIAVTNSGANGVYLNSSSNNNFSGFLDMGSNVTDCTVAGGVGPGLTTVTCAPQGLSTSSYNPGISTNNSFLGKVNSPDPDNGSAMVGGTISYPSITDWFGFSNSFRNWGLDGGVFPIASNDGRCSAGTCRLWDWRLSANDFTLRNTSGNGLFQNAAFTSNAPCPLAVNAAVAVNVMTDQQSITHAYLVNAIEVNNNPVLNPFGNNNGLCESGETCLYTPNIGDYQGDGSSNRGGTCLFQSGGVSNVQLIAYPNNGD